MLEHLNDLNESVYLIGSTNNVLELLVQKLNLKYKNLKIIGYHNGYFDIDNCQEIIKDIKSKKPYAVFVAMGSLRQELFIGKYLNDLPCKVFMGVGDTFDIISETKKRAPNWFIKNNLEWFFRIMKEPIRLKRFYKSILCFNCFFC